MLTLTRPLVVLDLETTGLRAELDRIWQIGIIKLYPDGNEREWEQLVNPQIPVSEWSFKRGGIPDLSKVPTFKELVPVIYTGLKDVDYCGFNLTFDLNFLKQEFFRAGVKFDVDNVSIVDAFKLFQMKHPRSLEAAVEEYLTPSEVAEYKSGAHTALVDSRATLRVLKAQLARWPDLPRTVDELHAVAFEKEGYVDSDRKLKWIDGNVCLAFGKKFNGIPLKDVSREYLEWILRGEFSDKVKSIVGNALNGIYPEEKK